MAVRLIIYEFQLMNYAA